MATRSFHNHPLLFPVYNPTLDDKNNDICDKVDMIVTGTEGIIYSGRTAKGVAVAEDLSELSACARYRAHLAKRESL